MDNTKTILLGILLTISAFNIIGIEEEPSHYCLSKEQKAYCFELRDYGDKINYRCLYDENNRRKYLSCEEGWEEIPFIEQVTSNSGRLYCTKEGCDADGRRT